MQILLNLVVSAIAVLISAYVIPGVTVDGFFNALVVAVILGVVNAFVRPLIELISLPINVVTLGLFSFVITALMIMLTAAIVPGFAVTGFLTALIFGVVLTLVTSVLYSITPAK
jgi:putative membrane protein